MGTSWVLPTWPCLKLCAEITQAWKLANTQQLCLLQQPRKERVDFPLPSWRIRGDLNVNDGGAPESIFGILELN